MTDEQPGTGEGPRRAGLAGSALVPAGRAGTQSLVVEHLPAERRLVAGLGGERVGVLRYEPDEVAAAGEGGRWLVLSTETRPDQRGRGVAGALVAALVAEARSGGRRVVPVCSYVVRWLEGHPDAADVLDRRS